MITLKLKAGLGNQLFQYAYGRAVALRAKTELVIDTSWYSSVSPKDTPRTFLLDKYNIQATIKNVSTRQSFFEKIQTLFKKVKSKITRSLFKYSDYVFYPKINTRPDNSIVEGFWNTELYFKEFADTIRKELSLKYPLGEQAIQKEKILQQMTRDGRILVLIHVRRGDYITNTHASAFHGAKGTEYYSKALARMQTEFAQIQGDSELTDNKDKTNTSDLRITFILSSDDIAWVKESIVPLLNTVPDASYEILSEPAHIKDYEELYLMSLCHHFIIANSSFSWWAAWLSTTAIEHGAMQNSALGKKIVIGPEKWTNDPHVNTKDVLPADWIRI
jgi:Glycosyl transferase family 11